MTVFFSRLLCCLGIILTIPFRAAAISAPVVSTTIPTDISSCEQVTYMVTVTNTAAQTQAAGTLRYCLPEGLSYAAVTGLAPADLSDPRCPVFDLPAIAAGAGLSFEIRVQAGCLVMDRGDVRDTIRITAGGVPQPEALGSAYNLRTPVITLAPGPNWGFAGAVGETFTRTFVLRNDGLGSAFFLFVIDPFAQAGLELVQTTGTMQGDTLFLTGTDLGPDGFLKHLDSVVVTQTFRLTSCDDRTAIVEYGWGCPDDSVCGLLRYEQYAISGGNSPQPNVQVSFVNPFPKPRPCEPELIEIQIENSGVAPAFGIEWLLGLVQGATDAATAGVQSACYRLSDFRVGNAPLPDLSGSGAFVPYQMTFSGLLSDPDGPGGLSDEDADGQFDDLAPGSAATVRLLFNLDPTCKACNELQVAQFVAARFLYTGDCSSGLSADLPENGAIGVQFNQNLLEIEQEFILDAGDTYQFSYELDATFAGLQMQCPDDSIVAELLLPVTLQLPPGFQPMFDSMPVPWWAPNDSVVYVLLPGAVGNINIPLLSICPPDIDDSATCTPPYEPRTYQMPVNIRWRCGNGCPDEYELVCVGGLPFTVDCPRPEDTSQQHGVFADTFFVRRLSVGYVDNILSAQVNPAADSLSLDMAIPYDTVLMQATARFEGLPGEVFDSVKIEVYYWNGVSEYFLPLGAGLVFEDVETGTTVQCPGLVPVYRYVNGYHIWETDLLPLTQPGGCLFNSGVSPTPGDRLHFEITARLTEALPYLEVEEIKDLRVRFPYAYHGDTLLCETKNAVFRAINPDYEFGTSLSFLGGVCDEVVADIVFFQGLSGRVQEDLFPNEIRPLFVYDSLTLELDPGYAYQPGSAVWLYFEGDGAAGVPVPQQIPLADPLATVLPNGSTALLFVRPAGLPVTDYFEGRARAILSFRLQAVCPPDTTNMPLHLVGRRLLSILDSANVALPGRLAAEEDLNELGLFTLGPLSGNRVPSWFVEYCNPGTTPTLALAAPLIFLENGPALQLLSATDVTNPAAPTVLSFVQTDADHAVIEGLPLNAGECRSIELRATVLDCIADTLRLLPGFQCAGAAAPCILPHPLELYFVRMEALPQVGITGGPNAPVDLCAPVNYELKIVNVGEGGMYDVELLLAPPPAGQTLTPGSFSIEYAGLTVPLPDPVLTPAGLLIQLDFSQLPFVLEAVPGLFFAPNNALVFHFQVETNCDYVDGTRFRYASAWQDACGTPGNTALFVAPPLQIEGAPTTTNAYQIRLETPNPASFCGANTVRISIANPGDLGPTTASEKVRVVLPADFNYVPGSLQPLHNSPAAEPAVLPFGDIVFLTFGLPANVAGGDSIVFEFQIQNSAVSEDCAATYPVGVQMLQTANVACATSSCAIDFVLLEEMFSVNFEKPVFALGGLAGAAIPADANLEQWNLQFQLNNLSGVPGGGSLQIEVLLDGNQNAQLDPGDALLLAFAADVEGLLPGAALPVLQTVHVAAALGCSGLWVVLTDTLCSCTQDSVFIPFVPLANTGEDRTLCAGEGTALGFQAIAGAAYTWLPASPNLSNSTVPDPAYQFAGPFDNTLQFSETLVLQTTRTQGCISFDTVRIVTRKVAASLSANPVLCHGDSTGSVLAVVQGAELPVQFFWDNNPAAGDQLLDLPAGAYTLAVVDSLGCTDTVSVLVTQPDPLAANLSVSNFNGFEISCAGANDGSIAAAPSGGAGGYQYAWTPAGAGPSLTNVLPGAYSLVLTDANGCTVVADAVLSEPLPLVPTITVQDEICLNAANGSIGGIIQGGVQPWLVNGQPAMDSVFLLNGLSAGAYQIAVVDANGCIAEADTSLAVQFSDVSVGADSVACFGENDGQAVAMGTGFPPFSFVWSGGQTQDMISGPAGIYSVTVSDALGCLYVLQTAIGQPPALAGTAVSQGVGCFGDSTGQVVLGGQGGTPPYLFEFNGQPVLSSVSNLSAGGYTFLLTDANGCTVSLTAEVLQPPSLAVDLQPTDAMCFGSSTGSATASASGGTPPYGYAWSNGATGTALNALSAGAYVLSLTDANGCALTDTTLIGEPEAYEPDFEVLSQPCADRANGILSVSGFPAGTRYGLDRPADRDSALFAGVGGGALVLFVEDPAGCLFEFDFDMPALPGMLGVLLADTTIRLGDSAWLRVALTPDVAFGAVQYVWISPLAPLSPCDTCAELWVQPFRSAYYTVQFMSAAGCRSESRVLVQVLRDSVYAPNVLYPDAVLDENRFFTLFAREGAVRQIRSLRVFDRWGEAVFERAAFPPNDYQLGWDGRYRGKEMPPGVFVWYAEVEYLDGVVERISGDVTVVR
ncbi:MAG: gliding motility-associated C-terminal domain-containing protein [Lewinellaceae bacterium]|nr:gliding motility-associated C-terminal domain-containing protein [Lewinellaceae bacterium]